MNSRILIADNDRDIRESLATVLTENDFICVKVGDGDEAIRKIKEDNFDILIIDIKLPKWDGIQVLDKVIKISPKTMTMMITDSATVETAIEALRKGAIDYLTKPLDYNDVVERVRKMRKLQLVLLENQYLKQEIHSKYNQNLIIGESSAMQNVYTMINKVAHSSSNILITGKSGTGKELVARAIHQNSPRVEAPFVPINCGAIPENLFESELFGFKKGSFTGAIMDKDGVFRAANGGTLFLDEVGEIPVHIQVKLLRAIEEKEIKPIGSPSSLKVDARILSATNKDLLKEIEEGNFREDLYYRLKVVEIHLPPLRRRRPDIPLLALTLLRQASDRHDLPLPEIAPEVMESLKAYSWPGNVRQLKNMMESLLIMCRERITLADLPPEITPASGEGTDRLVLELPVTIQEAEDMLVERTLAITGGNRTQAAMLLGMGRRTLQRKLGSPGDEQD